MDLGLDWTPTFLSIETQAQMITDEQVQAYANELVHLDFLTPKGKELLLNEIAKGAIEIDHPSTVNPITYTSSTLSREIILQFCYMAISSELMHRLDKEGWKIESIRLLGWLRNKSLLTYCTPAPR